MLTSFRKTIPPKNVSFNIHTENNAKKLKEIEL